MSADKNAPKVLDVPAYLKQRLKMRAERFVRLIELDAPSVILANEFLLVERTMDILYGDELGASRAEHNRRTERIASGICTSCDTFLHLDGSGVSTSDECGVCMEKHRKDNEEEEAAENKEQ